MERRHDGTVSEPGARRKGCGSPCVRWLATAAFAACCLGFLSPSARASDDWTSDDAATVARHLGLFLTVPARRAHFERVELRADGTLGIHMLRKVPAERREAVLCQGVRWLLLGRLASVGGIAALFGARPDVTAVELTFHGVETDVAPGRDGRYVQSRRERPNARLRVSREQGEGLDKIRVDAALAPGRCLDSARTYLDELWLP